VAEKRKSKFAMERSLIKQKGGELLLHMAAKQNSSKTMKKLDERARSFRWLVHHPITTATSRVKLTEISIPTNLKFLIIDNDFTWDIVRFTWSKGSSTIIL
jgi:hypothetical protein